MMSKFKTEVTEGIFPLGEVNPVSTAPDMPSSYNYPLVFDPEVSAKVANVSFEPGARTKWHKHVGGYQILLVTAGEGWYQQELARQEALDRAEEEERRHASTPPRPAFA